MFLKVFITFKCLLFLEKRVGERRGRETSVCERNIDQLPPICTPLGTPPLLNLWCMDNAATNGAARPRLDISIEGVTQHVGFVSGCFH